MLKNNETKAELLMRSKYLLMVSPEKWTPSQRERAEILFELYHILPVRVNVACPRGANALGFFRVYHIKANLS